MCIFWIFKEGYGRFIFISFRQNTSYSEVYALNLSCVLTTFICKVTIKIERNSETKNETYKNIEEIFKSGKNKNKLVYFNIVVIKHVL